MKSLTVDKYVDNNLKSIKDSDGTASGLEISSSKTRTKDLDVIGNVNVYGEIIPQIKKELHIINTRFYHSSGLVYIPLNGYIFEQTTTSARNEYVAMPVPYNGKVIKVVTRTESRTDDTVVGFHKSSSGTEVPNTTATSSVTVSQAPDDTTFEYDFTNLDNTFVATGHFRHGILLAPGTAWAISEMLIKGITPDIVKPFGLEKHKVF